MPDANAGHVGRPPSVLSGRLSPVLYWTTIESCSVIYIDTIVEWILLHSNTRTVHAKTVDSFRARLSASRWSQ